MNLGEFNQLEFNQDVISVLVPSVWTKIIIQGINPLSGELILINGMYKLP